MGIDSFKNPCRFDKHSYGEQQETVNCKLFWIHNIAHILRFPEKGTVVRYFYTICNFQLLLNNLIPSRTSVFERDIKNINSFFVFAYRDDVLIIELFN